MERRVRKLFIALMMMIMVFGGAQRADAQLHHVVGGDRGWEPSSDIGSWSSGRIFSVGDKIWFAYSAAQENIVELRSNEEYLSCDVSNPIRMYTDGLDRVSLDTEGIRYFASGKPESCKNGLKLHVEVQPKRERHDVVAASSQGSAAAAVVAADGPVTPSASTHLNGLSYVLFLGLLLWYLGL